MPKPAGTVAINIFVKSEVRDAIRRKCKANGQTMNFVLNRLLEELAADAPPAPEPVRKGRGKPHAEKD